MLAASSTTILFLPHMQYLTCCHAVVVEHLPQHLLFVFASSSGLHGMTRRACKAWTPQHTPYAHSSAT